MKSVYILKLASETARAWWDENGDPQAMRWGANGIAVEHRFIVDLCNGMREDGLVPEKDFTVT